MRVCKHAHLSLTSISEHRDWPLQGRKTRDGVTCSPSSWAHIWGWAPNSHFSTFIRFDSTKATFSLCSVYSCRRSSLAASIFRGFLEAWTRRLGLTARLCSATEDVNLRGRAELLWPRAAVSPTLRGLRVSELEHPAPVLFLDCIINLTAPPPPSHHATDGVRGSSKDLGSPFGSRSQPILGALLSPCPWDFTWRSSWRLWGSPPHSWTVLMGGSPSRLSSPPPPPQHPDHFLLEKNHLSFSGLSSKPSENSQALLLNLTLLPASPTSSPCQFFSSLPSSPITILLSTHCPPLENKHYFEEYTEVKRGPQTNHDHLSLSHTHTQLSRAEHQTSRWGYTLSHSFPADSSCF